jgi:glycerophosphoryl diester phosphodiesterase
VISFQADAVESAKKALPDIPAYYLASFKQDKETKKWTPTIEEIIATAKRIKADGVDLGYKGPVDKSLAKKVRDAGLGLYFWTVDEEPAARKLVELGADGITTNKGKWLGEVLSKPDGK